MAEDFLSADLQEQTKELQGKWTERIVYTLGPTPNLKFPQGTYNFKYAYRTTNDRWSRGRFGLQSRLVKKKLSNERSNILLPFKRLLIAVTEHF